MRIADVSVPARPVNVLVFTPTPTHPPIQGNRQRILEMCRALQCVGAELTMLYYVADGLSAAAAQQMRESWGDVEVLFTQGFSNRRTLVKHYAIDDWYDQRISGAIARICQRKDFDFCIVNYAWYSKAFEALPRSVVRIIDTHDIFGGRAERFAEIGLDPKWFHTSVDQETTGLDRADFVIAIQDSEASVLRERTNARVRSIGFLSPPDFLPARGQAGSGRLKVGYLGSGNPFNVACMRAFAQAADMIPEIHDRVDIQVAGQVCDALRKGPQPFSLHGVVDSVADFYRSVDVVINPMLGGTGLKMKSLEALSFGRPLVATSDAMAGIVSNHPGHQLTDMSAVIDRLVLLAREPSRLAEEAHVAREIFLSYRSSQVRAFLSFWSELVDTTKHDGDRSRTMLETRP
ncbi:MAG TPA: glycosyltransferase [Rhizomicrobium sp.]|jgi:glycosyltransferase involved in cell wall biosynthesis|nr:glycosyltransferase [Rhizomicrobium sp.]